MNCKRILTTLCLITSYATATLTPEQKTDFLREYGEFATMVKHLPPVVGVLFFDINGDGVEEAIATYNEHMYRDGCDWEVYALVKGEWEPVKINHTGRTTRNPISDIYIRPDMFFKLIEGDNKPPKLVAADDKGVSRICIDEDGFLIVKQFPEDQIKFRTNHEPLAPEFHTDIPPPKEEEINPRFLEKVDPETELWIGDPSVVPLPSNGLWRPERTRYIADFNNDGIPDMLLGNGKKGIQPDKHYTLYLRNAKGKYRKHATFYDLFDTFAIENKEKGVALFWVRVWKAPKTLHFGYYTITDKGVSDFVSVKTFTWDTKDWEGHYQAFDAIRKKHNVQTLDCMLDCEISETVGGKVKWIGDVQDDVAEKKPTSQSKLWLYAGILIGLLCAAFYFLRRKLKTGN